MDSEDLQAVANLARALDVWTDGMTAAGANAASADALAVFYHSLGMPARVRDLEIPRNDLPALAQDALKNFNANPGQRSAEQGERMLALLEAAW